MILTKSSWRKWIIIGCMLPAILCYLILHVIPSIMTAVFSFTDMSGIISAPWKFIGFDNYKELFFSQNYRDTLDALKRTIVFAFAVTLIQNVIALLAAVLLNNKELKRRNFYRAVIFLPSILGVMIVCYAWTLFFSLDGPASTFLNSFGAFSSFFGSQTAAFPLVIFVQIWMSMGYAMVIYIAGLQSIPLELYEAGVMDGTNPAQAFRRITIPLLWPTITVNTILSIIGSLSVVQVILLTTGGANNTDTLAMRVFQSAFGIGSAGNTGTGDRMRQGFAAAESMILFFVILLFTIVVQFIMKKRGEEV